MAGLFRPLLVEARTDDFDNVSRGYDEKVRKPWQVTGPVVLAGTGGRGEMDWALTLGRAKAGFFQVFGLATQAMLAYENLLAQRQDVESARALALLCAKAGRLAEAEKWFATVGKWQPADAENWFNLGFVRDALGQKREALVAFEAAVHVIPHFDRAWHAIGTTHIALGEAEQAVVALRRACNLKPSNAQALFTLGKTLHGLGRRDELTTVAEQLSRQDKVFTRQLLDECNRADLGYLLEIKNR